MENMIDRSYADVADDGELRGLLQLKSPTVYVSLLCNFHEMIQPVVRIAVDRTQAFLHQPITHVRFACAKRPFTEMSWTVLMAKAFYSAYLKFIFVEFSDSDVTNHAACLNVYLSRQDEVSNTATVVIDESGSNLGDTLVIMQGSAYPVPPAQQASICAMQPPAFFNP
jgi:hypothetical protein